MVDEARAEAQRTLDALAPHLARGAAVVGLEPSCLLGLRDEYLALKLGDAARLLASRSFLIEEFLVAEYKAGRLRLSLQSLPQKRALLHGHCHQKAFDAVSPVQTLLKLIPELEVELIESSCCGMAGSFGYEAEHRDVSLQMAELSLLPAVRAAGEDTLIVADGTSCRHQIGDNTARRAEHAIRVLSRALALALATPRPARCAAGISAAVPGRCHRARTASRRSAAATDRRARSRTAWPAAGGSATR